jgi:hypothetical protein
MAKSHPSRRQYKIHQELCYSKSNGKGNQPRSWHYSTRDQTLWLWDSSFEVEYLLDILLGIIGEGERESWVPVYGPIEEPRPESSCTCIGYLGLTVILLTTFFH